MSHSDFGRFIAAMLCPLSRAATAGGPNCDAIIDAAKGSLPDFPDFPDASRFQVPTIPIPRLLPSELQQSMGYDANGYTLNAEAESAVSVQVIVMNAAGGFAAGLAVVGVIGLVMRRRSQRGGARLTLRRREADGVKIPAPKVHGGSPSALTSR